jgi:ribosomal protein S18 acetylase RimI-like enzyme
VPVAEIAPLTPDAEVVSELADMLIAVVAAGGSVSFMHPLPRADAQAFWAESLAAARRGERVVLGARLHGRLAATVTLAFAPWPNQPHRAEIAKLMTAPAHRGLGLATALTHEAERIAVANGRTLLTLDTAEDDGASGLYERLGYIRAGFIPGYALKPHGGLTGTILYFKTIGRGGASAGPVQAPPADRSP